MRRTQDKERAYKMRKQGKSYSEIKEVLGVSKGTLSLWLRDMPLTDAQMIAVRDKSPRRIESFRKTMEQKRERRLATAYARASVDIGKLTKRELFIAGLFLYWGEGAKSMRGTTLIANTDPDIICFFLHWMISLGVNKKDIRVRLHLYSDMDPEREMCYWSSLLCIPRSQFRKPYIKTSTLSGLTYKNGFGHGTCNLLFGNIAFWEYVMMSLRYIKTFPKA